MRPFSFCALSLGLLICASASPARGQTFDAVADFSSTLNPNGPWSFGRSASACGAITLNGAGTQSGLPIWSYAGAGWGMAIFNDTGGAVALSGGLTINPQDLFLHPSSTDEKSVLAFNAPTAGCYQANTTFELVDLQNGDVDISVCGPGGIIESGMFSGAGTTTSTSVNNVSLQPGESISAYIGFGGDDFFDDSVDTTFTVTVVDPTNCMAPVPTMEGWLIVLMALLLLGGGAWVIRNVLPRSAS